ncbi:hypothetical protein HZH68_012839 [Vespula germanica]|uniref:Uncharacterized protein n=1 Tax=Vespula germanica TaxID=30212 RepID=A0A834JHB7_VESGE|nr:hypothetical protein HZH68_012839 [Vespula germanica]
MVRKREREGEEELSRGCRSGREGAWAELSRRAATARRATNDAPRPGTSTSMMPHEFLDGPDVTSCVQLPPRIWLALLESLKFYLVNLPWKGSRKFYDVRGKLLEIFSVPMRTTRIVVVDSNSGSSSWIK